VSESAAIGFPDHGQVSLTASSMRNALLAIACSTSSLSSSPELAPGLTAGA
jgi:hypothetical protein